MDTVKTKNFFSKLTKFNKRFLLVAIISLFAYYTADFYATSWRLSAVGRIIMIKLLPYWDWSRLYNVKCLISMPAVEYSEKTTSSLKITECHLCEKLDEIDILTNTTYLHLRENYLHKAHPVLVADSTKTVDLKKFLKKLQKCREFLDSDPCDVETNLMQRKFFNFDEILNGIEDNFDSSWFLQLRNCQFSAVKTSRKFIKKPYFYPQHLEPYYSSWILMSNNYIGLKKSLKLEGLIIVQQLQGDIIASLAPDQFCMEQCNEQEIIIKSGDSLVFPTDLWTFSYSIGKNEISVTTITETYY